MQITPQVWVYTKNKVGWTNFSIPPTFVQSQLSEAVLSCSTQKMADLSEWLIVICRFEQGNMSRNKDGKTVLYQFVNHGLKVLPSLSLEQATGNTDGGFEAKKRGNNVQTHPKIYEHLRE